MPFGLTPDQVWVLVIIWEVTITGMIIGAMLNAWARWRGESQPNKYNNY